MLKNIMHSLRTLFHRERMEQEFDEDIQFHIDMATEDNMKQGMEADEARRQTLIRFGRYTVDQRGNPGGQRMALG